MQEKINKFTKHMLLPAITNKQQEILKYLYHFRFLNRVQIQALLKHKDYKTINLWLKDLTEKEFAGRIYSNKLGDNTKPAVYYIGSNGIKYLRAETNCPKEQVNKLWREKERSKIFIENCQFLADIYLDLKNRSDDEIKFSIKTKSEFTDPDSPLHFLAVTGVDLLIEKNEKSMKKYYILGILDESLPGYSIRKRIKNYIDLYFSNGWEEIVKAKFPTILITAGTLPMLISTKRMAKQILKEYDNFESFNMRFAVIYDINEQGIFGKIWEKA